MAFFLNLLQNSKVITCKISCWSSDQFPYLYLLFRYNFAIFKLKLYFEKFQYFYLSVMSNSFMPAESSTFPTQWLLVEVVLEDSFPASTIDYYQVLHNITRIYGFNGGKNSAFKKLFSDGNNAPIETCCKKRLLEKDASKSSIIRGGLAINAIEKIKSLFQEVPKTPLIV